MEPRLLIIASVAVVALAIAVLLVLRQRVLQRPAMPENAVKLEAIPTRGEWLRIASDYGAEQQLTLALIQGVAGMMVLRSGEGGCFLLPMVFAPEPEVTALEVARRFLNDCSRRGISPACTAMIYSKRFEADGQSRDGFLIEAWGADPTQNAIFGTASVELADGSRDPRVWAFSAVGREWLASPDERL
jgi:hypothetical protein